MDKKIIKFDTEIEEYEFHQYKNSFFDKQYRH